MMPAPYCEPGMATASKIGSPISLGEQHPMDGRLSPTGTVGTSKSSRRRLGCGSDPRHLAVLLRPNGLCGGDSGQHLTLGTHAEVGIGRVADLRWRVRANER